MVDDAGITSVAVTEADIEMSKVGRVRGRLAQAGKARRIQAAKGGQPDELAGNRSASSDGHRVAPLWRRHLANDDYLLLVYSTEARRQVWMARPEGLEHALPTIAIEGVPESVELLRAA